MAKKYENVYEHGKKLRDYLNNTVLKKSFLSNGNIKEKELIDITNNYGWSAKILNQTIKDKKAIGENQFTHQIPFVMAFERKQTINSTIRNITQYINIGWDLLNSGSTTLTGSNVSSFFSNILPSNSSSSTNNTVNTANQSNSGTSASTLQLVNDQLVLTETKGSSITENPEKDTSATIDAAKSIAMNCIKDLLNFIKEKYTTVGGPDDHLVTSFLYPYAFMYMTAATGYQFVFPMLTDGSDYFSLTNAWSGGTEINKDGSGGTSELLKNSVTNFITGAVDIGAAVVTDFLNLRDALNGSTKSVQDFYIEKAKFYDYPTDGQKVKVKFVLYNTVQKDIWQKHYRFLYLFSLRNLPFKLTPFSYSPPLIYDLFLPGSKFLPLCYVSDFNVINQGVVRRLTTDSILKTGDKIQVSVPDAWVVDITFTCMLGQSANMMLEAIEHETSISVISPVSEVDPEADQQGRISETSSAVPVQGDIFGTEIYRTMA